MVLRVLLLQHSWLWTGLACFMQALGWLTLFLPAHGLGRGEDGWNDRIADWMVLWESDAHNKFWSSQWMLLFAQIAKHDTQGVQTITTTLGFRFCT